MNPPNEQVEIPAEAVEAFSQSFWNHSASQISPRLLPEVGAALQAAAPSIRQQERERIKAAIERELTAQGEAVLEKAKEATARDEAVRARRLEDDAASIRNCLHLALATLKEEDH